MIPYFQWISFNIGPITIQVWGLMVSLGILIALLVSYKLAKKRGMEFQRIPDLGFWVILGAMVGGRVFYILAEIRYYIEYPLDMFKVWEGGMSISGGFVFAVLAGYLYCKHFKLKFWDYAEVVVFGLPLGLFIGRLGCFFIFDHPGKETSFFLGEEYLDGIIRHNHGLYLSINGLLLFLVFLILFKYIKNKPKLLFSTVFLLEYGIMRFIIDFARAADPTFFGLTIAQYLSIFMFISGVYLLSRDRIASSYAKASEDKNYTN